MRLWSLIVKNRSMFPKYVKIEEYTPISKEEALIHLKNMPTTEVNTANGTKYDRIVWNILNTKHKVHMLRYELDSLNQLNESSS